MNSKSYYDILGVSPTANADEIRKAYLVRSKMFHPDRFNRTTQANEWQIANEMLQELNHAYSILRETHSRSTYNSASNRTSTASTQQKQQNHQKPPPQAPPPRPASNVKTGRLTPGFSRYEFLPKYVQDRIKQRVKKKIAEQFITSIHGVILPIFLLFLGLGLFGILFVSAFEPKWTNDNFLWMRGLTFTSALLIGRNLSWIVRKQFSPFKCSFIVSPLYFIKTHFDEVWFWPLWDLKSVKATHKYRNGIYTGTSVNMTFSTGLESFTFAKESAYESMTSAIRVFDVKLRAAKEQDQSEYFFQEDDFREVDLSRNISPRKTPSPASVKACLISVAVSGMIFWIAYGINSSQFPQVSPPRYVQTPITPNYTSAPQATPVSTPIFLEPVLPLPTSGEIRRFTTESGVAPLQIRSSSGSNYLVKLDNASTGQSVLSLFVRGGQTEEVLVPMGTYTLKYASGGNWYGYQYRFGPATQYSKADQILSFTSDGEGYNGHTVTLYKVANGNLITSQISQNEFGNLEAIPSPSQPPKFDPSKPYEEVSDDHPVAVSSPSQSPTVAPFNILDDKPVALPPIPRSRVGVQQPQKMASVTKPSEAATSTIPSPEASPIATPLQASLPVPSHYQVVNLPSGDFLNIREGPGSNFQIIGRSAIGNTGVLTAKSTVLNGETNWQQITTDTDSVTGWVNRDYLLITAYGNSSEDATPVTLPVAASDSKIPILKAVAAKSPLAKGYFTIGSSMDDVVTIMGTPTSINNYESLGKVVWHYGYSAVTFKEGKVVEWSNLENNLKVRLIPAKN